MHLLARILGALVLLVVLAFCIFGFMATYEFAEPAKRWPWQLGYGGLGLVCLGGVLRLCRRRQSKPGRLDVSP